MTDPRPVPGDPGAEHVMQLLSLEGEPWLVTAAGAINTMAVETFQQSGAGYQRVVALDIAARLNGDNTPEGRRRVRLLIGPEDAVQLAGQLGHTAVWILAGAE